MGNRLSAGGPTVRCDLGPVFGKHPERLPPDIGDSKESNSIVYKLLAQKASLSPEHNFIAYQTYQPPHGSLTPHVQIGLLPTRDVAGFRRWQPQILFDDTVHQVNPENSRAEGNFLCSSGLFWSNDEKWIGFCTQSTSSDIENIVVASCETQGHRILVRPMNVRAICQQMGQDIEKRCTSFVEDIKIGISSVDVRLRTTGSVGFKVGQTRYSLESFETMHNKPANPAVLQIP